MDKIVVSIGGKDCLIYSAGQAEYVLVQPVDDHDLEVLDEQVTAIAKAVPVPFVFCGFPRDRLESGIIALGQSGCFRAF